jgi:hypothetical protein
MDFSAHRALSRRLPSPSGKTIQISYEVFKIKNLARKLYRLASLLCQAEIFLTASSKDQGHRRKRQGFYMKHFLNIKVFRPTPETCLSHFIRVGSRFTTTFVPAREAG